MTSGLVAASVGGGVLLGATVFSARAGIAQEASPTASSTTADDTAAVADPARAGCGADLAAAAKAIGISEAALRTQLANGTTIAAVAGDHSVAVADVVDALVAAESAEIDQTVADGRLTQAQATEKKAGLRDRMTAVVNGDAPLGHGDRPDDAA
jgi:hypothetical protein